MKTSSLKTMMIIGMMTFCTATTFGKTNANVNNNGNNHQKHTTIMVINHSTSGKFDRDKNCSCTNCITFYRHNQHDKKMAGGYTQQRNLTKQEKQLFKNTYNGRGKDKLTPISVATQVVNGTNYKFICKDKRGKIVTVVIYQSLPYQGSKAKVISIINN